MGNVKKFNTLAGAKVDFLALDAVLTDGEVIIWAL